jgi:hypothetical protein
MNVITIVKALLSKGGMKNISIGIVIFVVGVYIYALQYNVDSLTLELSNKTNELKKCNIDLITKEFNAGNTITKEITETSLETPDTLEDYSGQEIQFLLGGNR